jgi:hypothetical protein
VESAIAYGMQSDFRDELQCRGDKNATFLAVEK